MSNPVAEPSSSQPAVDLHSVHKIYTLGKTEVPALKGVVKWTHMSRPLNEGL